MNRAGRRALRQAASARYMAAHEALWRNQAEEEAAGIRSETEIFLDLNDAANKAAQDVSAWRQAILDWRVGRMLDREGIRL